MREGFYPKEAFRFDPATDTFTCPGGQILRPCRRGRSRDNVKIDYSNREACPACQLRPRCTGTTRRESAYPVADALRAQKIPFIFATGYDAGILPEAYADVPCAEKPIALERALAA